MKHLQYHHIYKYNNLEAEIIESKTKCVLLQGYQEGTSLIKVKRKKFKVYTKALKVFLKNPYHIRNNKEFFEGYDLFVPPGDMLFYDGILVHWISGGDFIPVSDKCKLVLIKNNFDVEGLIDMNLPYIEEVSAFLIT